MRYKPCQPSSTLLKHWQSQPSALGLGGFFLLSRITVSYFYYHSGQLNISHMENAKLSAVYIPSPFSKLTIPTFSIPRLLTIAHSMLRSAYDLDRRPDCGTISLISSLFDLMNFKFSRHSDHQGRIIIHDSLRRLGLTCNPLLRSEVGAQYV
jgi:hypothetical protein